MGEYEIFESYLEAVEGITLVSNSSEAPLRIFFDDIRNVKSIDFDKPDFILLSQNKAYLFEHFQFDSSEHKKSSSLIQEEKSKKSKEFETLIEETRKHNPMQAVKRTSTFETNTSVDFFYDNFVRSFNKHYKKISNYIKNSTSKISNEDLPKDMCFFVENASIMTDIVYKNDTQYLLTPFMYPKFCELISLSYDVLHIFYGFSDLKGNKKLLYFYNNQQSRIELLNNGLKIDNTYKYFDLHPVEMAFNIFIPKK